jgi:hypothetical protein
VLLAEGEDEERVLADLQAHLIRDNEDENWL